MPPCARQMRSPAFWLHKAYRVVLGVFERTDVDVWALAVYSVAMSDLFGSLMNQTIRRFVEAEVERMARSRCLLRTMAVDDWIERQPESRRPFLRELESRLRNEGRPTGRRVSVSAERRRWIEKRLRRCRSRSS